MLRSRFAAVLLAAGLSVTACGEPERVLSPDELQRGVSAALKNVNRAHEKVECAEGVKAQVAESTTCTMTQGGQRFRLTVIVKSVEGDRANYDVDVDPNPLP